MTQDKAQETRNHTGEGADDLGTPTPPAVAGLTGDDRDTDPAAERTAQLDAAEPPLSVSESLSDATRPASAEGTTPDLPPGDLDADLATAPMTHTDKPAPARSRSGVVPLVLGGALAAALGFGAASYLHTGSLWPDGAVSGDLADRMAAQELALAALAERLDAAPDAPDVTPLSREIADLRADLVAATDALRPEVAALADRVAALEGLPFGEGQDATAITAALSDVQRAWQEEIATLKTALGAQDMRIEAIAAEANARLAAAQEEIAGIEAAATDAATAIARRGAVSRVLAALDAGGPFTDALAEAVADGTLPPVLAGLSESGAPTLALLQAQFPEAARAALATARAEGLAGEASGFVGFLRNQFDVRSTAERAGDDPDAILSRAEARLRDYDLDAALAEIAALPEVVRAALGEWLTLADTRKAALAEADALSDALNEN